MKNARPALAVLVLALAVRAALAQPAATTLSASDQKTASAMDPATEQALGDVGNQQMMDSVKKDEDQMLKSGVYKSIDRTPDGKGAIITMPDGAVMWSDYVRGFDTMPKKTPADLLAMMQKDPNADPGAIAALKKAVAAAAQKDSPDQKQLAKSEAAMFGGSDAARAAAAAAPAPEAAPGAAPQADAPAPASDSSGASAAPEGAAEASQSAYNLGRCLAQSGLLGGAPSGAADPGASVGAGTAPPAPGALDAGRFEFLGVRRAAGGAALHELQRQAASPTTPPDPDLPAGQRRRGFGATTNQP
ncbi:MAG: hypothetical protein HKL90_14660 [Elusimicrobia bacterium]|nr:hypothetical protein [Elusimicrobiota bacterium]